MRTHPLFVACANALIPGTGYLILKQRVLFGALLLAGTFALVLLMLLEPKFVPATILTAESGTGRALELLWYTLFTAAYAADAYLLAKDAHVKDQLVTNDEV